MKRPTITVRWVWLALGALLLPFTDYQSVIPLASWLAPILLLRFVRTAPRAWVALALVFAAYAASILVNMRGGQPTNILDLALGLALVPLLRGIVDALPYAADRLIGSRSRGWARLLVFPLAWTSLDWLMSLFNATGTFSSPAYSQDGDLVLMQLASVTGLWGVTFLIMWCASSINAVWESGLQRRNAAYLAPFVAALLIAYGFGLLRLNLGGPASQTVTAATITIDLSVSDQAGNGIDWATFNTSTDPERAAVRPQFEATVDQMLARTETALRAGATLVGWQEGAVIVLEEDKAGVIDRAAALARQYHAYLQLGIVVSTQTPTWPFLRNESILIDPSGTVVWTYDKTHPVVGSESLTTIRGPGVLPVADTPYGRLSTAICNDMGYPELLRQAGQNQVDVLFAPTHDIIPWAATDAAEAHYRAIENGFTLLRATGNGPSLMVDPQGRILAEQDYFTSQTGILLANIPTHGVTTVYGRIGDVFAYLGVLGLLTLVAWSLLGRRQPMTVVQRQPV